MKTKIALVVALLMLTTVVHAGDVTSQAGDLYVDGKIGIGTTNPSATLTVNENIGGLSPVVPGIVIGAVGTSAIWHGINSQDYAELRFDDGVFNMTAPYYAISSPRTLALQSNSFSDGYVGIGTFTPTAKLDVNGDLNATGNVKGSRLCIGADCRNAWPSAGSGTVTSVGSGAGLIGGPITSSGTLAIDFARVNTWTGNQKFNADTNFPGSGIWNSSGSVGIGTNSPAYKLDVSGDVRANGGWLRTTGSTGWFSETFGGGWHMTDTTWLRSFNGKSVYVGSGLLASDGGITVGNSGASPPSGGAIIDGNTGIGTTTPKSKLDVKGNTSLGTYAGVTTAPANGLIVSGNVGIGKTSPAVKLDVNGFVNIDGNLGVGTVSPAAKLHVVGDARITGISSDGIGKAVCIKSTGDLGTCTTAPNASGICTCT